MHAVAQTRPRNESESAMNKLAIAIPCVISGLVLGAMTLTHALAPLPGGGVELEQQSRQINVITVLKLNDSQPTVYGCSPGTNVGTCIVDAMTEVDDDNVFILTSANGTVHCGSTAMLQYGTCQYSQAVFAASCSGRCLSASIAADQYGFYD